MFDDLVVYKDKLQCLSESAMCDEAIEILEDNHLRCTPILDQTNTMYRGNIYRYHIYQYKYHHPDSDLSKIPVTRFLKNSTRVFRQNDHFYRLFFAMKDLPYLAVIDENNAFVGVIPHDNLIDFLAQAWAINRAGYILFVKSMGKRGDLNRLARIINRYSDISSSMFLDRTDYRTHAMSIFVLPEDVDKIQINQLVKYLSRKDIEHQLYDLQSNKI
ncbi:cyclic di-AMP binding protein CbpA [Fundicoccus culcitae]|uniref:Cyclic di-AMP binding protein CbpA n=1 Tax=Fundicoccus culcitae TaxID=2969821 RepID=A0ABY5P3J2_9LACT|nr:cyclic di-AMP binding protein CbpA [Fundicoccus culcitae]UUX33229.1 cyclic di-AMP binding protein CbpA [Fundicoccus culcitae]